MRRHYFSVSAWPKARIFVASDEHYIPDSLMTIPNGAIYFNNGLNRCKLLFVPIHA